MRAALAVAAVLAISVAAGIGVSALPLFENDLCVRLLPPAPEPVGYSSGVSPAPLGIRCDLTYPGGASSAVRGPSIDTVLGSCLLCLLVVGAARRRPRPAYRGAAVSVVLLGLFGWMSPAGEYVLTALALLLIGPPVAYVVDRWLRPHGGGARLWSAVEAVALTVVVLAVWTCVDFTGFRDAAPGVAVLAGAALSWAAASLGRLRRPVDSPRPGSADPVELRS